MIYAFYVMFFWFFYGSAPASYISVGPNVLSSFRADTAPFWDWLLSWPASWFSGVAPSPLDFGNSIGEGFAYEVLPYVCAVLLAGVVIFLVLRLVVSLFSMVFGRRAR